MLFWKKSKAHPAYISGRPADFSVSLFKPRISITNQIEKYELFHPNTGDRRPVVSIQAKRIGKIYINEGLINSGRFAPGGIHRYPFLPAPTAANDRRVDT